MKIVPYHKNPIKCAWNQIIEILQKINKLDGYERLSNSMNKFRHLLMHNEVMAK